jgi:hypothetical protein
MFHVSSQFGPLDDFASAKEPMLTFKLVNTDIYKATTKFDSSSEVLSEGFLVIIAFTDSHSLPTATPSGVFPQSGVLPASFRGSGCLLVSEAFIVTVGFEKSALFRDFHERPPEFERISSETERPGYSNPHQFVLEELHRQNWTNAHGQAWRQCVVHVLGCNFNRMLTLRERGKTGFGGAIFALGSQLVIGEGNTFSRC